MILLGLTLAFLLSVVQVFWREISLVLLLVLVWAILGKRCEVIIVSFLAGFFVDLAQLQRLGSSSLFFLIFAFFVFLYKRRFNPLVFAFLPLSSFFASLFYDFLLKGNLDFKKAFFTFLLAFIIRFLLKFIISHPLGAQIEKRI